MVSNGFKKIIQGGPVEHHTNLCGTPSASRASATLQRTRRQVSSRARIGALAAALILPGMLAAVPAKAGVAEKTVAALEALANKGSVRAQYELAQHYERADGVKADPRLALSLYCRAARQDYADAALMAGRMHMAGVGGVNKDAELGRAWLRKAAALGSEQAERLVGSAGSNVKTPDRCEPPNLRWGIIRKPPAEIRAMVQKMAPTYGLDPDLVLAVIAVESGYRIDVVSNKNAQGLMQLIPETAERFGVTNPFDAEQNLRGGMKYLRWLLAYFDGNVTHALAGYNAGEGAVLQYKGIPPYRETQDYVVKIRSIYAQTYHPFNRGIVQSAGLVSTAREEVAELSLSTRARSSGKR
ncbi:Transglycosylase, Slt family [Azospirillum largimobile]